MGTRTEFLDDSRTFADDAGPAGGSFLTRCGQISVFTRKDPTKQAPSDDIVGVFRAGAQAWVLAVADGVGGSFNGRAAAMLTLNALEASLGESLEGGNGEAMRLRTAVLDGIERANRAVLELGGGAATTLAVAELGPGYMRPYHVGDSSILLVGQRGKRKLQTVPHSPVGFAVEAGLLEAEEAIHHEMLHIISNVIGSADMRIEVGPELPLAPRDTLLLASDGLLDNMLADEIVEVIRCGPLDGAIRQLGDTVARRMMRHRPGVPSKPDDCSVVLYRPHSPASARIWQTHEPGTLDWLSPLHAHSAP